METSFTITSFSCYRQGVVSTSSLTIHWVKPDLHEERWEYTLHPAKQEYYRRHAIEWGQIVSAFDHGTLEPYPRSNLIRGNPVALSYHTYEEYLTWLARAKRGYRKNYTKMEEALQRSGSLTMKSPIILLCHGEALLFSGYRRLCLAWNYGMVPLVWLVPLP
jgi:hypothetical protein